MKRILLITTGGTIACADVDRDRTPETAADGLLEKLRRRGDMPDGCEVTAVSLFSEDSTNMPPAYWLKIKDAIRDDYGKYDGFVITHGTDTMGYAAALMSCVIVNSAKPVVITGSMRPFDAENSDGPRNLRNAIRAACDERVRGVCVLFGDHLIDGRCASKTDNSSLNAVESVNRIPLAAISADGEFGFRQELPPYSGEVKFYHEIDERLTAMYLVPGSVPPTIARDTRAVLILGFGTGGFPGYFPYTEWITRLTERGIYVIMTTQAARGGSDLSLYRVGSEAADKYAMIDAGKMTAEYASMRAMWALAEADSYDSFRSLFLAE